MRLGRRRWWTRLITIFAVLMIAVASLSLLFRLALDAVPGYRGELERLVATSVGHPARVGAMGLSWQGLRPTLELRDIALLDAATGAPLLEAAKLRLGLDLTRLLGGHVSLSHVEATGVALDVDIDAAGRWTLRGFEPGADAGHGSVAEDLARFDSLALREGRVLLHDARLGTDAAPLEFRILSATIRHARDRFDADAAVTPPAALSRRVTLHASMAGDPAQAQSWHGDWTLGVDDIAGSPWLLPQLTPGTALAFDHAALRAAGTIVAGRMSTASGQLQAARIDASLDGKPLTAVSGLQAQARAQLGADGAWRLDLDHVALRGARGLWNAGHASVQRASDGEGSALVIEAERLRLDDLLPWLALWRALPPELARLRDAHGDVQTLHLQLTPPDIDDRAEPRPHYALSATLIDLALAGSGTQPAFSGISGALTADNAGGRLTLAGTPLQLQFPDLFERPLPVDALRGELAWRRVGRDWRLTAPALMLRVLGATAEGSLSLLLPGAGSAPPELDLHLQLLADDVARLKPFMPKDWGPSTRAWLARALVHGRVTHGELRLDAPMTPRDANGRVTVPWRLALDLADATLDYAPNWPIAQNLAATLHFHDGGVDIDADAAIAGAHIGPLHGGIADFHSAELLLDGHLDGDAASLYRLLRMSPLKTRLGGFLDRTEASGPARAEVHLQVPLSTEVPDVHAHGEVVFDDAVLHVRGLDEPLRSLSGRLAFGAAGVTAEALSARLYDTAIRARIAPEAGVPDGVLVGEFELAPSRADGVAGAFVPAWLRASLSGQAPFRLRLPFSGPESGRLGIESELQGVASTLPAPLAKSADASLPLKLRISGDERAPLRLDIAAGDSLRVGVRFAGTQGQEQARGVEVRLGAGVAPRAEADGLRVTGVPAEFDLGGWIGFLSGSGVGASSLPFLGAELSTERLLYSPFTLGRTHLVATPIADGVGLRFDGAANGSVEWTRGNGGQVQARLQSLALDALPNTPADAQGAATPPEELPFDPGTAPVVDIDAAVLRLGEVELGHLQVRTARIADGQRIEKLALDGGKLDAEVQGAWRRQAAGGSSAELEFKVDSSAIAEVLPAFGYAANLRAQDARFSGKLAWARVPAGLELAQARGEVALDVRRGALKAVHPGAGRVLGLINLYALPRRLLLDFRDVTAEGLSFDTLTGGFTLADGDASTDDLQINGPQAKVQLRGRIGLAQRDYDQRVTVYPDISTGVTLGATLLGGPIGGGIALVAQSLFGKPFNRLARFSYRVTGSWDNPEVIRGSEDTAIPAAPPAPAANGVRNG